MHTPCAIREVCEERPPGRLADSNRNQQPPCPACRGARLDPACAGHWVDGHWVDGQAVLYCGCPACGGADVAVTLGHSDLAALAAD